MTVVVVGAGLAGLCCALDLQAAGVDTLLLEASDGVGGRVRTDEVDGYRLDRGFQVLLTAYPEVQRRIDLAALALRPFTPGAMVWAEGRGFLVTDPLRDPAHLWSTLTAPIGSPLDKARIAWLRHRVRRGPAADLLRGPEMTTAQALRGAGFSERMLRSFFGPLVGGIQLDPQLGGSRRMFDIVFRMLAEGSAAVPEAGMGALPAQLATGLRPGSLRLDSPVQAVTPTQVTLTSGERIAAEAVVVATEGPAAATLLGRPAVPGRSVGSVWFAMDALPLDTRAVVLDGSGTGPVLNVAMMSAVAPTYAPAGRHLLVAAAPGHLEVDLEHTVRTQLRGWWGAQVDGWDTLAVQRIAHGQPAHPLPLRPVRSVEVTPGLYVCGDHRDTASIQGAMYSGRRTAVAVQAHLTGRA